MSGDIVTVPDPILPSPVGVPAASAAPPQAAATQIAAVPQPLAPNAAAPQAAAPPQAAAVAPQAAANGAPNNSGNTSAMQLFAPDPNAEGEPLDLDELFHDCYFGDFPLPEDVTSGPAITAITAPAPIAPIIAPAPAIKRTAEQAGLTTIAPPPPAARAAAAAAGPVAVTVAIKQEHHQQQPQQQQQHAQQQQPAPIPSSVVGSGAAAATAVGGVDAVGSISARPAASLTESQKIERRERNREHAKRSRLRKKFLLESLQEQIEGLQGEIRTLKDIVKRELPAKAAELLKDLGDHDEYVGDADDPSRPSKGAYTPLPMPSGFGPVKTLMEPDYRLMSALSGSQQNFAISDPSLPDNPIVYVSQGFLDLTGYSLDQVLGRNCRFLQGPGTDQAAVDVIRKGVREGTDTSVCLLNYKADGTPFWNQFFVAALRDAENNVVNFVGVQCEVSKAVVEKHISEGKTPQSSLPLAK